MSKTEQRERLKRVVLTPMMTDDEARRIITAILEECAPGWRIWGWEPGFILLNKGAEQLMLDRPFTGKPQ